MCRWSVTAARPSEAGFPGGNTTAAAFCEAVSATGFSPVALSPRGSVADARPRDGRESGPVRTVLSQHEGVARLRYARPAYRTVLQGRALFAPPCAILMRSRKSAPRQGEGLGLQRDSVRLKSRRAATGPVSQHLWTQTLRRAMGLTAESSASVPLLSTEKCAPVLPSLVGEWSKRCERIAVQSLRP